MTRNFLAPLSRAIAALILALAMPAWAETTSYTPMGGSSSLTIGTTPVSGATTGYVLYHEYRDFPDRSRSSSTE